MYPLRLCDFLSEPEVARCEPRSRSKSSVGVQLSAGMRSAHRIPMHRWLPRPQRIHQSTSRERAHTPVKA